MVKIETIHSIQCYFGSEFLVICNHCKIMAAWSHKTLKICYGQPPTMYSECFCFHPNLYTFGGLIAKRVNTAKTHRKVNPIFGWSLASSQIIYAAQNIYCSIYFILFTYAQRISHVIITAAWNWLFWMAFQFLSNTLQILRGDTLFQLMLKAIYLLLALWNFPQKKQEYKHHSNYWSLYLQRCSKKSDFHITHCLFDCL